MNRKNEGKQYEKFFEDKESFWADDLDGTGGFIFRNGLQQAGGNDGG